MQKFFILALAAIFAISCSLTDGATIGAAVLKTPTERPQTTNTPEIDPTPTQPPKRCTVTTGTAAGRLNLRSCPGTGCGVIGVLEEGQAVTILAAGDWLKVQTEAGAGYINSNYCRGAK
jgi:uncharacterized protein YgiM (DUF1202 family)